MRRQDGSARPAHGTAKETGALVVIERPKLADLVPRVTGAAAAPPRPDDGRFTPGELARFHGAAGGRRRAQNVALASSLGLRHLTDAPDFQPYAADAARFVEVEVQSIARAFGECGPGPSSVVQSSGLQLAASRYLYDRAAMTNDPALFLSASRLSSDSRQGLVTALHLAELDAKAREKTATPIDFAARWSDPKDGPTP